MLGKVNYFYKEAESNIKEKKNIFFFLGGGRGENSGWRGLELVILLNYEPKFTIKKLVGVGVGGGRERGDEGSLSK